MCKTGEKLVFDSASNLLFGCMSREQVLFLVQKVEYLEVLLKLAMKQSSDRKWQVEYNEPERNSEKHDRNVLSRIIVSTSDVQVGRNCDFVGRQQANPFVGANLNKLGSSVLVVFAVQRWGPTQPVISLFIDM
jgi:hypothetical protein